MRVHFDLVDLRLMVNVAEASSLTRGAEASAISLAAASARVRNLEDSLGTRLLQRTPTGATLTPSGQALVHHARAVLGQLERLRGDLQQYAHGLKGHLRVFANATSLSEYLPAVLRRYLQDHPAVDVDLRERLSHDIVRAVADGQADVGIVAGLVSTPNLVSIPYRKDHLVLVVPRDHPMRGRSSIEFAQTLELDHVALQESSAIHAFLAQVCDRLHRTLRTRIQVGNFETACRMIEAGVGVGVLPKSAASRHAQAMAIAIVPLDNDWAERSLQICVRDLDALPGFARDLVELLIEDARLAGPHAIAGQTTGRMAPAAKIRAAGAPRAASPSRSRSAR